MARVSKYITLMSTPFMVGGIESGVKWVARNLFRAVGAGVVSFPNLFH